MYEYDNRGSAIKNVILQLLFIVVFVFILIWLFPTKGYLKNVDTDVDMDINLDPLYNQIYSENLKNMKEAAKDYYTTERLPKNTGDTVSMTLGEMLDKNLILPLSDSEGNQCDEEESYVEVTKMDEEYILKTNLKCGSNDNYLLVHMGCYDYCDEEICENADTIETSVGKVYTTGSGSTNANTATSGTTTGENKVINNNNTTINNNNTTINNSTTNNNITIKPTESTTPDEPDEPNQPNEPTKVTTTYYEYREVTVDTITTKTKMCKYHPVTTESETFYTLGYTSATNYGNDIDYPFGIELPEGAYDPYIKSIKAGYDYFNYSEYRELKNDGRIFNYTSSAPIPNGVTNMPSNIASYSLTSDHISHVLVYRYTDTKGLRLRNLSGDKYKIDYSFILDIDEIQKSANKNELKSYSSNMGKIYYVPIKFVVGYDMVSTKTKTKECDELSTLESQHIVKRYTETDEKEVKTYGNYKWTTNPNLKNVEYSGKTKQIETTK